MSKALENITTPNPEMNSSQGRAPQTTVYRSSAISLPPRFRRTKQDIVELRDAIYSVVAEQQPMTVRQVFYQMVSRGYVPKTEHEYKQSVARLLKEMRLDGTLPFGWIVDNTRWMRKPQSYNSLSSALRSVKEAYRRDIWEKQPEYVEVWIEKDALSGVVYAVTEQWDVPLFVVRGFSSITYLYEAARNIARQGKPAYIYYMGDYDPSGVAISANVEKRLREFAPEAELHFERIAVTPEQIEIFQLPLRPTKQSDSRSKNFTGDSVELDAMKPADLRALVEYYIAQHVNSDAWADVKRHEGNDSKILDDIVYYVDTEAAKDEASR